MVVSCMRCKLVKNCEWTKSSMWHFIDVEMQRNVCETNQIATVMN